MLPQPFRNTAVLGAGLALAAGTLFSFGGVTVRLSPHLDPFQYNAWRCVGLIPLVFLMAAMRRRSPWRLVVESGWLGLAGGVALTLAGLLFIVSMKTTTVANALLFASGAPLLGALMARILLKEAIGAVTWVAIGLGAIGLLVMTGSELGAGNFVGNAAAVGSAVAYAIYSIAARVGRHRDMSGAVVDYALMIAAVSVTVVLWSGGSLAAPPFEAGMAMLHGGLFVGGGMILFNLAARSIRAGQLTLLAQTETILGPVWVYLLFREEPRLTTVAGGALILLGVMLSAWASGRAPVAGNVPDHRQEDDGAADYGGKARVL
jgi:drug/metabolite transporter (DMT)-like permease